MKKRREKKLIKLRKTIKKKLNNYVLAFILLACLFSIIGFSILSDAYKINNKFIELLPHSENSENGKNSWIKCHTSFDTFVDTHEISCTSYLNHHDPSFKLIGVKIEGKDNYSDYLDFEINEEGRVVFDIPVYEGENKYHLKYNFNQNNTSKTLYRDDIKFRAISEEIYFERVNQKYLLIFAVLSFSLFSIVASMKYLRDLIEGNPE